MDKRARGKVLRSGSEDEHGHGHEVEVEVEVEVQGEGEGEQAGIENKSAFVGKLEGGQLAATFLHI